MQLNEIPDWNRCAASNGYGDGYADFGELSRLTLSARNIALLGNRKLDIASG